MQTLRVFISSPGDVQPERLYAERLIKRLANEFANVVVLEAYFWEYEPMQLSESFQPQIESTSDFDLVICILWSRLGTSLTGPDGKHYDSGTEYEVTTAMQAWRERHRPEVMLYINQTPASIKQWPKEDFENAVRQLQAVMQFQEKFCRDPASGQFIGAYNSYKDLGEFEVLLEEHLRRIIRHHLPAEVSDSSEETAQSPVWRDGSPFRGLEVFDSQHELIFFGRTRAVGEVLAQIRRRAQQVDEELSRREMAVVSAEFSPDGHKIVTASGDHTVGVWDSRTGLPLVEPLHLEDKLEGASFSRDGSLIITACDDGTAQVWNSDTGQPLTDPLRHEGIVYMAGISSDARQIVTASADKSAHIWDFVPRPATIHTWLPELVEAICRGRLAESGSFESMEKTSAEMLSQIRQELGNDPEQNGWVHRADWLLADPTSRNISPFSKVSVPNYIERQIQRNTDASLHLAEHLSLGNPQLAQRVDEALLVLHQKTPAEATTIQTNKPTEEHGRDRR